MPFIRCCVCDGRISENAQTCPKCGDPDPSAAHYLIAKLLVILRECHCPIGQNSLDEAHGFVAREALYHKVCELLVGRSIHHILKRRQNIFKGILPNTVTFKLPRMTTRKDRTKFSHHNFMVHALSRYFFNETKLTEPDMVHHRERYFQEPTAKAPYYYRGALTDAHVDRFMELE